MASRPFPRMALLARAPSNGKTLVNQGLPLAHAIWVVIQIVVRRRM